MTRYIVYTLAAILLTACSHTYYVVRHAEKAAPSEGTTMSTPNNPPLSQAGTQRAEALKEVLKNKHIDSIFSTNTIRTMTTAEPLRSNRGLAIQTYGPMPDAAFIQRIQHIRKNVLIVGHSNTVDDIVNGLTGAKTIPADLQDSQYDNLFVITVKGKKVKYKLQKFGTPTP
jgi:broad specificity phosphatase PhoE